MKKTVYLIIIQIILFNTGFAQILRPHFEINSSSYAYNGESGSHWEETRVTLTYFESIIEPVMYFQVHPNVTFRIGSGILIPFNKEEKIASYYPVVQTAVSNRSTALILGSLINEHRFPAFMKDPLASITPRVRGWTNAMPIQYESYPENLEFTQGKYEYGIQLIWNQFFGQGELFMDWQLPDTAAHRERFDIGLTHSFSAGFLPLYFGYLQWHNGGHEHDHAVGVTENYTASAGLKNRSYSLLYFLSAYYPDRDGNPDDMLFGQGFFAEYRFSTFGYTLQPLFFITDEWINPEHRYFSVEGDPFYRTPFYAGINFSKIWYLSENTQIILKFRQGAYLPDTETAYDWKMIRYDQMLKIDLNIQLF